MTGIAQSWMKYLQTRRSLLKLAMMAAMLWMTLALTVNSRAQLPGQDAGEEEPPTPKGQKKPAAEVVPPPAGMSFTTRLDRTAVWVGDQFHYLITVNYTP